MGYMKSPAFQFYPNDFLSDKNTLVMSTAEIGAYCLLMFVCWAENGLPDNLEELASIARLPVKQFQPMWERRIERCFKKREDGKWVHGRLEKEREKQAENRAKRQAAGAKGAEVRWQTDSNAIAMPGPEANNGDGKRIANDSLSSSSSISNKESADAGKSISEKFKDLVEFKGGSREGAASFLGKCKRDYPADEVEKAAAVTVLRDAEDPKAYMTKLLSGGNKKPMSKAEMNRAGEGLVL